ncbi:MAG: hypothetical protein J6V77_02065 [Clostridia bacterium]|nr:hypothetical protein [Clostridia bacterium]MBO7222330.1 hypothetical protein [Clostridia bacterium]
MKNELSVLAEKYNLEYQYQEFPNSLNGSGFVYTHSLYNEFGCFTIHCYPQRGEIDCYYAERFSTNRKQLCGTTINVYEYEKEIWRKHDHFWIFRKPFFYWSIEKIKKALLEVIAAQLKKGDYLFNIRLH